VLIGGCVYLWFVIVLGALVFGGVYGGSGGSRCLFSVLLLVRIMCIKNCTAL
jgi:hypothetical protein